MDSIWLNGTFAAGKFIGYEWFNGTFLSGHFDLGIWYNGTFKEMKKFIVSSIQDKSLKTFIPILMDITNESSKSFWNRTIFE